MQRTARALLFTLSALIAVSAAVAESSPEAKKYLAALSQTAAKQSFRADYTIAGKSSAMGQPISVDITGQVTQADRAHMRATMNMTMTMKSPQGGDDMKMAMTSLVVSDGSTMWTEMDNPMMGGKQVMKIGLEQFEKAGQSDAGLQQQLAALDPLGQMRRLTELFDFDVAAREAGTVTLEAKVTAEGLGRMGIAPDLAASVTSFAIDIDEKTSFVREVRIAGAEPVLTMRVDGFESLSADDLDTGLFSYTPPDGVQVVDLSAASGG